MSIIILSSLKILLLLFKNFQNIYNKSDTVYSKNWTLLLRKCTLPNFDKILPIISFATDAYNNYEKYIQQIVDSVVGDFKTAVANLKAKLDNNKENFRKKEIFSFKKKEKMLQ